MTTDCGHYATMYLARSMNMMTFERRAMIQMSYFQLNDFIVKIFFARHFTHANNTQFIEEIC